MTMGPANESGTGKFAHEKALFTTAVHIFALEESDVVAQEWNRSAKAKIQYADEDLRKALQVVQSLIDDMLIANIRLATRAAMREMLRRRRLKHANCRCVCE